MVALYDYDPRESSPNVDVEVWCVSERATLRVWPGWSPGIHSQLRPRGSWDLPEMSDVSVLVYFLACAF